MPSLGSDRSLNAKLYQETGKVEFVSTYSVYDDKTGKSTNFDSYQAAADYMNSIGGSAMNTAQYQATVRQSGGAVTAVYEDGRQVDLQNNRVQDEVLLNQNKANATGESPATVNPTTDPQASAGETVAEPPTDFQQDGNTSGYGEPNETQVPASEVRLSAKDLEAAAARNNVDAGDVDTEVGIVEAQLYRDEATAREQSEVSTGVVQAQNQETYMNLSQQMPANTDWRVTLRLAPGATYLYNAPDAGLLQPLKTTNGVIFPYTPTIGTAYKANYDTYDLTHSNYRGYFYKNSYTDAVSLKATFTAQSTADAAYVLAVIHFFRSVTKMFYGQDAQRGSPPPLVFLSGLGDYQFNNHPCVVSSFSYNLPAEVDYISSGSPNNLGLNLQPLQNLYSTTLNAVSPTVTRLAAAFLPSGAQNSALAPLQSLLNNPTYVPSKLDIDITLLPIQSRQQVSKQFSLKNFANGNLLKGGFW
jgi:hypothetical protein